MAPWPRRVVCAGGAVLDLKLHLLAPSVAATSNPATLSTSFGGVARNVAENLAVLLASTGIDVELVSAVGDDVAGADLLRHARDRGIGVEGVRILPGRASSQYVALLEPGGELTVGAAAMDVLAELDVAALEAAWPADGWLFCDANLPAAVLTHAIQRGRRDGTPVAIDAVSTAKATRLPADLTGLRLLCWNVDEARAWAAVRHHWAAPEDDALLAEVPLEAGAQAVLLTRGGRGLIAADAHGTAVLPPVPATVVDVTGAGDALVAGALALLMLGSTLVEAARAGSRRAALTIESPLSVLSA